MTQSKPTLSPSYFQDFTLRQAEEEIVGACIDHEHALTTSLSILAVDDFRSEVADDLRLIYYTLTGWYARGAYDPDTNRERLLGLAEDHTGNNRDLPAWEGYLEMLWCPWGVIPEYVEQLCRVVARDNKLADAAIEAAKAWHTESTLRHPRQAPPSPAPPRWKPQRPSKKGGHMGGVAI